MVCETSSSVGDFLLTFGPSESLPGTRGSAGWGVAYETASAKLYFSIPSINWKGSPLRSWETERDCLWLLGEVWGERKVANPADWPGHFMLITYDKHNGTWSVSANRLGTFHAYYALANEGWRVSSYSAAVEDSSSSELDWEAIGSFFYLGFFLQDRTYWKSVRIIRPSEVIAFDRLGKIESRSRNCNWLYQPDEARAFSDTVDAFAAIFHQVINEQIRGRRVAIPISGGLDSRSTVAALPKEIVNSGKLWAYSYGYSGDSVETRIAEQIARARGLPFQSFSIAPYLFDKIERVIESVEGFQDITQCRQAGVAEELGAHADYVMAAHWGDVWLDNMGLVDAPNALSHDEFVAFAYKKFVKKGGEWFYTLFPDFLREEEIKSSIFHTLSDEAGKYYSILDPDFRLKILKTELWSHRWTIASLRMFQSAAFPLLPFYDPRLVDFFCGVPSHYLSGRRLQIEYLKRYSPDLARIRWQVYDANLFEYTYFQNLLLPRRALSKLKRVLRGGPAYQRNWEVQFLNQRGQQGLSEWLLDPSLKLFSFISIEMVKYFLEQFYQDPSPINGYAVSMLLTFSRWLQN